jgi:hypothetical protein
MRKKKKCYATSEHANRGITLVAEFLLDVSDRVPPHVEIRRSRGVVDNMENEILSVEQI